MGAKMTVPVPFFPVISKQLRILGSFRYGMGDYPLAISLVERGLIDLKPLVTHVVEFEEALEAFEHTRKGKDDSGKVSQSKSNQVVRASTLITYNGSGIGADEIVCYQMYYQCSQVNGLPYGQCQTYPKSSSQINVDVSYSKCIHILASLYSL